jgi:hypothetical protein
MIHGLSPPIGPDAAAIRAGIVMSDATAVMGPMSQEVTQ